MRLHKSLRSALGRLRYRVSLVATSLASLGDRGMRRDRLCVRSVFKGLLQTFKECYAVVRIDLTREDSSAGVDEHKVISWSNSLSGSPDLIQSQELDLWKEAVVKVPER